MVLSFLGYIYMSYKCIKQHTLIPSSISISFYRDAFIFFSREATALAMLPWLRIPTAYTYELIAWLN